MKKTVVFKIGQEKYELLFTIKSIAKMEKAYGQSITRFLQGIFGAIVTVDENGKTKVDTSYQDKIGDIDFIKCGLECGLVGKIDNFDAYEFIDEYCENGGILIELFNYIVEALLDTGLFIKGVANAPEPTQKTKSK